MPRNVRVLVVYSCDMRLHIKFNKSSGSSGEVDAATRSRHAFLQRWISSFDVTCARVWREREREREKRRDHVRSPHSGTKFDTPDPWCTVLGTVSCRQQVQTAQYQPPIRPARMRKKACPSRTREGNRRAFRTVLEVPNLLGHVLPDRHQ